MATEKRLIDANAYKNVLEKWESDASATHDWGVASTMEDCIWELDAQPTVDAVEVVRGEWTIIEDDYCGLIGLECSHCEKTWWFDEESPIGEYHFCPGCGADMRERKDND